ncbi:hypothetical protein T484DRAFT_1959261 [Baffinella frigidus]|nr:hypothetical protein T484DRAFT_1959261 [Cryptophyta sp. CCMP2293]
MVHGSWFMVHGSWCMVQSLWFVVYSLWCMALRQSVEAADTHMPVPLNLSPLNVLEGSRTLEHVCSPHPSPLNPHPLHR